MTTKNTNDKIINITSKGADTDDYNISPNRINTKEQNDGIMNLLDFDELEMKLEEMKKKKIVLQRHRDECNYKITPPNPNKKYSYWKVWVKKEGEERTRITKKTEQAFINAMYDYYFPHGEEIVTLNSLYPEFIENRKKLGLSEDTLRIDRNIYDKFYDNHPIMDTSITALKAIDITTFINECIIEFGLTKKATHKMKKLMKELCALATLKDLTNKILFAPETFRLDRCLVSLAKMETPVERAVTGSARESLIEHLKNEHKKKPSYMATLALLLSFQTGLRNGELSALKLNMVDLENEVLYIRYAQRSVKKKTVEKKLKNEFSIRSIPLNREALHIVKTAIGIAQSTHNPEGYLFVNTKGKRYTARAIASKLERSCKKLNLLGYSMHDIRRGVATLVYLKSNNNINATQKLLGHANKSQTYEYIHDQIDDSDVKGALDKIC